MSEERATYQYVSELTERTAVAPPSPFVDVRARNGRLLFRLDGARKLVEWREGSHVELIDLQPYLAADK